MTLPLFMWLNKYHPPKRMSGSSLNPPKTADPLVSTRFTPQTTTGNYCLVVASSSSAFQLIDRDFFPGNHRRFIFSKREIIFLRGRAISSQNTFLSTSFRTINGSTHCELKWPPPLKNGQWAPPPPRIPIQQPILGTYPPCQTSPPFAIFFFS